LSLCPLLRSSNTGKPWLSCGILNYGFVRVRSEDCGESRAMAFSCQRRGWCPSCMGRRMVSGAPASPFMGRADERFYCCPSGTSFVPRSSPEGACGTKTSSVVNSPNRILAEAAKALGKGTFGHAGGELGLEGPVAGQYFVLCW